MKTILFIFLPFLALSQNGQTESEIQLVRLNEWTWDTTVHDESEYGVGNFYDVDDYSVGLDTNAKSFRFDEIIMMSDLLTYQTECYNDSTERSGWIFVESDYPNAFGLVAGWDEWQTWWHHREPTITGFIEWLKKRKQ